jgi:hypothetical protein
MRDKQTPSPTRRSVLASLGALSAATALEGCTGGYLISATSSSPATAPAVPWDVVHVPITGQSLANGDQTQPVVSGSQPFANVMFNTNLMPNPSVNAITLGATTVAWVPLTATLTGNPTAQNAETLGNGFADTVIAMSALTAPLYPGIRTAKQILMSGSGVSGAVYLQICGPTDAPPNGTASVQELLAQVRAAKAFATAANKTYFVPCVVVIHGEFDNYNPAYLTDLLHWQADIQTGIQAITGQTATIPLILAQTCVGDLDSNSSPYAQWQAAVQYPDRFILAGPEYQLPHNAGDPTHLTIHLRAIGERMLGAMVARAYRRVFLEGGTWTPLSPKAVTLNGNKVVIDFYVPTPPLVLDTSWCTDPGSLGFYYYDTTAAAIASVTVTGPTQVTLTLTQPAGPTPGSHIIGYAALDEAQFGLFGPTTGSRGCLRDSCTDAGYYDATDAVPSYNYSIRWGGYY